MKKWQKLLALFTFATAMALLEAIVVLYLRTLFAKDGLATNLEIPKNLLLVEQSREAATIVMLLAAAFLSFRMWRNKLITFFWIFAVWDIFYYIFLKLILDWPESFKTLDVLFLIPSSWVAPVWFPIIFWGIIFLASSYYLLRKFRD